MKRPALFGICLVVLVGIGFLLWKESRSQSAQAPGNQIVTTPDGQLVVSPARAGSFTVTATLPKKTNSAPAPPASR